MPPPFITRAEFDSLKNNFQSQIDQYNSSIDSKIDGAIASYLAGIKLSQTQSFNIIKVDDETEINFLNGDFYSDHRLPNVNGIYNVSAWSFSTWSKNMINHKWFSHGWTITKNDEWADEETNYVPLCGFMSGDESRYDGLYYRGTALRYNETWNLNYTYGLSYSDLSSYDVATRNKYVRVYYPFALSNLGYYNLIQNKSIYYNLIIKTQADTTGEYTGTSQWTYYNNSFNVYLDNVVPQFY